MPKQTFLNLKSSKKSLITEAFLREFSVKTFDDASLSDVVKNIGIAKGSVYQYFDDKLDLFFYLVQESTMVKMKYVGSVKREDHPDYWTFFKVLYEHGLQFDRESPLQSHFLHNLVNNLHSPSVAQWYRDMEKQIVTAFEGMAKMEIDLGCFRDDIPLDVMGFMLYKVGAAIQNQLEYSGIIESAISIQKNEPVFAGKEEIVMDLVDKHIQLVRPAFDK
ncbi:MAG: TetR/AcrR family transcriptional regulator [Bacteroidia bacterium]|nr:TetR/AcrR family transcriptional regulator [Bacteroidia bacterium]